MSYTPVDADTTAVAAYVIARLGAAVPSSGAVTNDQNTAVADSYLGAIGIQGKIIDTHGPGSANQTGFLTFGNMPTGGSGTYTAAVAKTYRIDADLCNLFCTVATTIILFQIVVNGVTITPTTGMQLSLNTAARGSVSFRQEVAMVAGSNTIQFQWKIAAGSAGNGGWDTEASMVVHVIA